jgi:ABC-type transport system involved in multi-copper enzyme maturation permease subunit
MNTALESALYRAFRLNPCVAVHELRMRMRGWRPFGVLLAYSCVAAGAVLIALIPITLGQRYFGGELFQVGRIAFATLAHTQLTLIMLILPAYAAGAIALEREKRTLEMLRVSLVTPFDVVTGKLVVVLAFGAVLLGSSLPVAAWCMMLGGIAPDEVFYSYSYLLIVALFVTGLGMLLSAFMKRSTGAVAATYGILIAIGVLSLLVPSLLMIPAIATTGSTALGPFVAFGGTLVLALITGWLGFLLLRALLQRLLGRRRRGLAALLAIPVVLGWMWYLMNPSGAVFQAIENSHVPWLMVFNPYAALSSVMGGAFAEFVASGPAATPAGGPALPLIIWAVITAIYLLAGAALWAGAVRVFAARRD